MQENNSGCFFSEHSVHLLQGKNFLTNHLLKELWKSVHICRSYYQTSRGFIQCIMLLHVE